MAETVHTIFYTCLTNSKKPCRMKCLPETKYNVYPPFPWKKKKIGAINHQSSLV